DAAHRSNRPAFWRRRYRWHHRGRADLSRRGRHYFARHAPRRTAAIDPQGRKRTGGARYALPAGAARRIDFHRAGLGVRRGNPGDAIAFHSREDFLVSWASTLRPLALTPAANAF